MATVLNFYEYQTTIPGYIMTNEQLSPLAKLIYARLTTLVEEEGYTQERFTEIANQVGANKEQAIKAMNELIESGFIGIVEQSTEEDFVCEFYWHESMGSEVPISA